MRLGQKDTHKYLITFRSSTVPALIRLSSFQCVVTNSYSPTPMRCKKCQKLGHTKNQCRNKTEHCQTCVNCGESHPPSSNYCPHYVMRREILCVQADKKITFREARGVIRVSNRRYNFDSVKLPAHQTPTTDATPCDVSPKRAQATIPADVLSVPQSQSPLDLDEILPATPVQPTNTVSQIQQIHITADVHNYIDSSSPTTGTNCTRTAEQTPQ